jgi:uncharacterized protein (TIGR02757 family)
MVEEEKIRDFFDRKLREYDTKGFIQDDPVCIPHLFSKKQDKEIAGFFAAVFAWGNRTTIINKSKELMGLMDMQPHDFCLHASPQELKRLQHFKHRTFTADDLLYFVDFLRRHYQAHRSLEKAFTKGLDEGAPTIERGLIHFRKYFFEAEHLKRTEKHIASPLQHSACKRINMFLRWMVRKGPVDLGLWKNISPAQLVCPLDLHVHRVARRFNMIESKTANWDAAVELTQYLKRLDAADPIKYDLVLFNLGLVERY